MANDNPAVKTFKPKRGPDLQHSGETDGSAPLWRSLSLRESALLSIVVVALITSVTFRELPGFDFVSWDDCIHVYQNPYFASFQLGELSHFWTHPYEQLFIPISYTVFGLLTLAAHRQPGSEPLTNTGAMLDPHLFHAANLVLHIFNVVLVYLLLRRMVRQDLPSVIGAVLFAVHPLQVESVGWISELRGLLSAAFCLVGLHLFVDSMTFNEAGNMARRRGASMASFLAVLCGLLSKPTAVVCGPIIAAISYFLNGNSAAKALRDALPYCILGLVFVFVTSHVQSSPHGQVVAIWLRPFVAGDALAFYLAKFLFPIGLAIDYGRKPMELLQHWWAYLDWIFPAGVAATAVLLSRRAPYIGLGLTISLFALLPVLGLVPFVYQDYSTTADRYMYFAMLGPALIMATMLADLTASIKRPIYCLVSLWLAALSFLSFRQSLVWRNSQALYTNAVSVNPRSGVSQNGLGNELENQHIYGEAAAHYFIATEDAPTNALFRVNLGQEYFLLGDLKDAEREYRTTILNAPGLARAHRDLGILLLCENKTNEGIAELKTAVRLNPRDESTARLISEQEKALDR